MSRGGSRRTSARSSRACRTHATVPSPPHTRTRRSGTLPAYRSSASRGPRRPMSTTSRALRSGRCARSALSSSPRRPPLLPLTKMRRGGSGEGASNASDTGFAGAYARGGCGPRDASRRADATGRRPVRGRINWRRRDRGDDASRARARRARARGGERRAHGRGRGVGEHRNRRAKRRRVAARLEEWPPAADEASVAVTGPTTESSQHRGRGVSAKGNGTRQISGVTKNDE